jgi:hypothetical protein
MANCVSAMIPKMLLLQLKTSLHVQVNCVQAVLRVTRVSEKNNVLKKILLLIHTGWAVKSRTDSFKYNFFVIARFSKIILM